MCGCLGKPQVPSYNHQRLWLSKTTFVSQTHDSYVKIEGKVFLSYGHKGSLKRTHVDQENGSNTEIQHFPLQFSASALLTHIISTAVHCFKTYLKVLHHVTPVTSSHVSDIIIGYGYL